MGINSRRHIGFSALLAALAVSAVLAAPASGAQRRMALGVTAPESGSLAAYDNFTAAVGRAPATWTIWRSWLGSRPTEFPDEDFLGHMDDRGTVPLIIWEPANPDILNKPRITYKKILAGKFDRYIRRFARAARNYGRPVILRFAHEMDGSWFPWGVDRFDNSPAGFKRMWRYVRAEFRDVGATNVKWLWSPTGPCNRCRNLATMYPGDRYVDYVGVTVFNWGAPNNRYERRNRPWSSWKSMLKAVTPGVQDLMRFSNRPIIIAELGSTTNAPRGKSKAGWIRAGYPDVYQRFRRVRAIVYFNIDMRAPPDRHENWSLESPGGKPQDEYRRLLTQSRFQGRFT
jgi:hypothetical protein